MQQNHKVQQLQYNAYNKTTAANNNTTEYSKEQYNKTPAIKPIHCNK